MSNSTFNKPSNDRENEIEREVDNILKKNKSKNSFQLMEDLRAKFRDEDIVANIMKRLSKKMDRVKKIAIKIKERLLNKYPNLNQKQYIEKIQQYKDKYKFDDSEMQAIINLVLLRKDGLINSEDLLEPAVTDMGRALGFVPLSYQTTKGLRVEKDEQEQLDAIKTNYHLTRELHHQVTIQSLLYNDCEYQSFTQSFDKLKVNLFNFVHPVVAALFIPKFKLLDHHMLLASIAGIITKKMEGIELNTLPEYELYWDIATDPADMACVTKIKPFTDLLNRVNIQTKLWEAVLELRQGKYYVNDITTFLMAIDSCRASVFDAADLAYVKDEGTILRKLFAAFSLRPTIVFTVPSVSINTNPNISNLTSSHITTLSMYTLRIPLGISNEVLEDIDLQSALTQDQIYIHHRQLTIKKTTILYSREILVYYIHRRYQHLNIQRLTMPWSYAALPITMSQFERLQDKGVYAPDVLQLSSGYSQQFSIKSVVAVETRKLADNNNEEIIISCSTLLKCPMGEGSAPSGDIVNKQETISEMNGGGDSNYFQYNPLNIGNTGLDNKITPISNIGYDKFSKIMREKGTLFIYQAVGGKEEFSLSS
jgi:hypothetical protein